MAATPNSFDGSFVNPEGLRRMGTEYPVQLGKDGVAAPLRDQVARAMLVVQTEAQKLAEVVGEIGCNAAPLHARVDQRVGLVPAHAGVGPAIELPLAKNSESLGSLVSSRRSVEDLPGSSGLLHRREPSSREQHLASEKEGFPFALPARFPSVHEVKSMQVCRPNVVSC